MRNKLDHSLEPYFPSAAIRHEGLAIHRADLTPEGCVATLGFTRPETGRKRSAKSWATIFIPRGHAYSPSLVDSFSTVARGMGVYQWPPRSGAAAPCMHEWLLTEQLAEYRKFVNTVWDCMGPDISWMLDALPTPNGFIARLPDRSEGQKEARQTLVEFVVSADGSFERSVTAAGGTRMQAVSEQIRQVTRRFMEHPSDRMLMPSAGFFFGAFELACQSRDFPSTLSLIESCIDCNHWCGGSKLGGLTMMQVAVRSCSDRAIFDALLNRGTLMDFGNEGVGTDYREIVCFQNPHALIALLDATEEPELRNRATKLLESCEFNAWTEGSALIRSHVARSEARRVAAEIQRAIYLQPE